MNLNLTNLEMIVNDNFEDARTRPTIETLLERVNALADNVQGQLDILQVNVSSLRSDVAVMKSELGVLSVDVTALGNEFHLHRGEMESRLDRIEGVTKQTLAEMLNFRADFRAWKEHLKQSPG